jgi:hypothetical protein
MCAPIDRPDCGHVGADDLDRSAALAKRPCGGEAAMPAATMRTGWSPALTATGGSVPAEAGHAGATGNLPALTRDGGDAAAEQ